MLRTGLGQHQRAIGKIESRQILPPAQLRVARAPVQASRDHQVQHQPEVAVEAESNPLSDATELPHGAALGAGQRRLRGSQQERARHPDMLKHLADHPRFESGEVGRDVGQFGHGYQIARLR